MGKRHPPDLKPEAPTQSVEVPPSSSRAGVTLFEALATLAILVVIMSISAASLRGPSDGLRKRGMVADLMELASRARLEAIRTGVRKELTPPEPYRACEDAKAQELVFFANGSASLDRYCVQRDGQRIELSVDPLTGRLSAL